MFLELSNRSRLEGMISCKVIILVLVLAIITVARCSTFARAQQQSSLRSEIVITSTDATHGIVIININELWSSHQRRRFVSHRKRNRDGIATDSRILVDYLSNKLYIDDTSGCRLETGDNSSSSAFSDNRKTEGYLKGLLSSQFIAGVTTLLNFIDQNRDQLRKIGIPLPVSSKNIPLELFSLDGKRAFGPGTSLIVGYKLGSQQTSKYPIEITIDTPGFMAVIELSLMMKGSEQVNWFMSGPSTEGEKPTIDQFNLQLLPNCFTVAYDNDNEFIEIPPNMERFNFRAHHPLTFVARAESNIGCFETQPTRVHSSINFDSTLNILRVDRTNKLYDDIAMTYQFDFHSNWAYYIIKHLVTDPQNSRPPSAIIDRILKGNPASEVLRSQDRKCVSTNIHPDGKLGYDYSIAQTLFGTTRWSKMGRGKVGPQAAVTYGAELELLPYWLESPVYQIENGTRPVLRNTLRGRERGISYRALWFLDAADRQTPLALMIDEISRIDGGSTKTLSRHYVNLYDFYRNSLEATSSMSIERRQEDVFSLPEECHFRLEQSYFSRPADIEIRLRSLDAAKLKASKLSKTNSLRNLALLSALQIDLNLSPSYISGISSSVVPPADIILSFRVTQPSNDILVLRYIGQASCSRTEEVEKTLIYLPLSFHECYFLSAHRRFNGYFGFYESESICVIDMVKSSLSSIAGTKFTLNSTNPMSLYSLEHVVEVNNDSNSMLLKSRNWLTSVANSLDTKSRQIGRHVTLKATISTKNDDVVECSIGKFEVAHENDLGGKTIEGWAISHTNTQLIYGYSQDHCLLRCLGQLNCLAYSTCIDGERIECGISQKATFAELSQLILSVDPKQKRLKISNNIDTNNADMELVRRKGCAIYEKKHLDLFAPPQRLMGRLTDRKVVGVTDENECARLCFTQTLMVMKKDINDWNENQRGLQTIAKNSIEKHHQNENKICGSFLYIAEHRYEQLDRMLDDEDSSITESKINQDHTNTNRSKFEAYCLLAGHSDSLEKLAKWRMYGLDYRFKSLTMFKRQTGIELEPSVLNEEQKEALARIHKNPATISQDDWKIAVEIEEFNLNIQTVNNGDPEKCAHLCLFWRKWPACRSFDVVEFIKADGQTGSLCKINSINRASGSIKQQHLTEKTNSSFDKHYRAWHFEPQDALVASELNVSALSQLVEDSSKQTNFISSLIRLLMSTKIMLLSSCIVGILVGLKMSKRIGSFVDNRRQSLSTIPVTSFDDFDDNH